MSYSTTPYGIRAPHVAIRASGAHLSDAANEPGQFRQGEAFTEAELLAGDLENSRHRAERFYRVNEHGALVRQIERPSLLTRACMGDIRS